MKSPLVLAADRLRISFQRAARDRFGHTIELITGGSAYAVLASIEGTADEPWPASPPFQEAHIEQRAGGRQVVLLVGMAGSCHWSGSVEIDPLTNSAEFDIACRMRLRADWLGSRYAIDGENWPGEAGQLWIAPRPRVEPSGEEYAIRVARIGGDDMTSLLAKQDELRIAPATVESASVSTVRWRYTVAATVGLR